MGNCLSCFRPSAQKSDLNLEIRASPKVVKEPKGKTLIKKVEADLSKLATPDETEKSIKHLYTSPPPKKESAISLPRRVENVNTSAGLISDSRSTLSSFFDHTCDDWSPKVDKTKKSTLTDLQDKPDKDVTSSTSQVKQQIQEPELIGVDEPTKQVDSSHSIDTSDWDDSVTSSSDLGEASKLLQEIDTMTADDDASAQSVDDSKSNKLEDLDATEPQPNDSFSSLFDEEESKLLQDILREDQERLKMDAAAEDEIELTADLCLLGTSIRKGPDWRPSADVPDDADADGLTEVDDDSETSDDSLSFDMDNADTRPIDGRDASALYDNEELDMIQDILRDDQQRDRITTTPDDDTELTVARPMPAGVFHGRDDGPFHDQVESDMIQDILRDDRRRALMDATPVEEDIEVALATCRPLPSCVVNEGEFRTNDAWSEEDTDDSFDIEDYLSTSSESEEEADGFQLERPNTRVEFHVTDNNDPQTVETSEDAAFASELEDVIQIDDISSPKAGRSSSNERQDSLSSSPQVTKQEDDQEFQLEVQCPKSRMGFHADEGNNPRQLEAAIKEAEELDEAQRLINEIDAISSPKHKRSRPYQRQDSLPSRPELSKSNDVQEFSSQRQKSRVAFHANDGNSRRQVEASEEAALASDLHEADRLLSQIDSISSPKPRRRRPHQKQDALSSNPKMNKREEELGETDRQRHDIHEIRPRTRRGRLETIENSTPRPKTKCGRMESPGLSGVNTSVNGHGDTPMVSYDEEESNLMDEILREQEAKLKNDEIFMDEIVATAELSILGTAGKR